LRDPIGNRRAATPRTAQPRAVLSAIPGEDPPGAALPDLPPGRWCRPYPWCCRRAARTPRRSR